MRIHIHRWLTVSALLASGALLTGACTSDSEDEASHANAGAAGDEGGGGTGGGTTGGRGGTGGSDTGGGAGEAGAETGGGAGETPTAGSGGGGGETPTAGSGGTSGGGGEAPQAGAAGTAGAPQCLGDEGTAPDCSDLPGADGMCVAAGGAGGAAGADGLAPVGVGLCNYYADDNGGDWRAGPLEAFADCVADINNQQYCSQGYANAVLDCEDEVRADTCPSESAATYCLSIECLGGNRLAEGECERLLSPYSDLAQAYIMACYTSSGADDTNDCDDALWSCL